MMRAAFITAIFFTALMTACSGNKSSLPIYHARTNPATLSEWGLFTIDDSVLKLTDRVTPYDLNSPLFSDYAFKLRTVWLPKGQAAQYVDEGSFDFPIGTILSKTFYYPTEIAGSHRVLQSDALPEYNLATGLDVSKITLVETRILVHRDAGWVALPYVWNAQQNEARLKRAGDIKRFELMRKDSHESVTFSYLVPNVNQCAGCHAENATTKVLRPIGPKARHLNKTVSFSGAPQNQLTAWKAAGWLTGTPNHPPKNADWNDPNESLNARARAYLDINCSHCHNATGPADTSGLHLRPSSPAGVNLGTCKMPIAAGTGTGGRRYDIVPGDPAASIFTYRMTSTNPASMMPELGRALKHAQGVKLISDWIAHMEGQCEG